MLTALRQPLQHGETTITRGHTTVTFPARFTLIAGIPDCPCGGHPGCDCTLLQGSRYRARATGPLGAYIAAWSASQRPVLTVPAAPWAPPPLAR